MLDFIKKAALNRVAGKVPMIAKVLKLLVDTPGFKRSLTVVLSVVSIVLKHLGPMFTDLCDKGYATACSFTGIAVFASNADQIASFVDKTLVPGLDAATLVFGIVGLTHALTRKPAA
jgi:hypothetical protein